MFCILHLEAIKGFVGGLVGMMLCNSGHFVSTAPRVKKSEGEPI